MRIAVVGSNGQVASDVVLHLDARGGIALVPISRTRSGSAFLRFNGIACRHGSITDAEFARAVLVDCDVVANFALAGGTPSAARMTNDRIVDVLLREAPKSAIHVFFSTLAVSGTYDERGRRSLNSYGALKLKNEDAFLTIAERLGRKAYVLRLGHVAGPNQAISQLMRDETLTPPVAVIDPDRSSNIIHTISIADALLAIGEGRSGPPGRYDLVNTPQWSWREAYQYEASVVGERQPVEFVTVNAATPSGLSNFKSTSFAVIQRLGLRDRLMRVSSVLSGHVNDRIKAEYFVNRARGEISALSPSRTVRNGAVMWPAHVAAVLTGLTPTIELIRTGMHNGATAARTMKRWPHDIGDATGVTERPCDESAS